MNGWLFSVKFMGKRYSEKCRSFCQKLGCDVCENWRCEHECDATGLYSFCLCGAGSSGCGGYFSLVAVRFCKAHYDESDAEARAAGVYAAGWQALRHGCCALASSERGAGGAGDGVPAQIWLYRIRAGLMSFWSNAKFASKNDDYSA